MHDDRLAGEDLDVGVGIGGGFLVATGADDQVVIVRECGRIVQVIEIRDGCAAGQRRSAQLGRVVGDGHLLAGRWCRCGFGGRAGGRGGRWGGCVLLMDDGLDAAARHGRVVRVGWRWWGVHSGVVVGVLWVGVLGGGFVAVCHNCLISAVDAMRWINLPCLRCA